MPFLKKSRSNDALSVIGSVRTGRLNSTATSTEVDAGSAHLKLKKTRWALRIVQFVACILQFSFLKSVSDDLIFKLQFKAYWTAATIFAIILPLLCAFLASMYLAQWFRKWKAKRILTIETTSDTLISIWMWAFFIVMLRKVNVGVEGEEAICPPDRSKDCNEYNWASTWTFFAALAWTVALATDGYAIWAYNRLGLETQRLVNEQNEMDIRRQRARGRI